MHTSTLSTSRSCCDIDSLTWKLLHAEFENGRPRFSVVHGPGVRDKDRRRGGGRCRETLGNARMRGSERKVALVAVSLMEVFEAILVASSSHHQVRMYIA